MHAGSGTLWAGAADELGDRRVPKIAKSMRMRNTMYRMFFFTEILPGSKILEGTELGMAGQ